MVKSVKVNMDLTQSLELTMGWSKFLKLTKD